MTGPVILTAPRARGPHAPTCYLPPEMIHPLKGKPEYYLRTDSFQVTGDGHGHQASAFSRRNPGASP